MSNHNSTVYTTLLLIIIAIWFVACVWLSAKNRKIQCLEYQPNLQRIFQTMPWYKKLNIGAFGLSPIWLFSNGFWITAILYLIISVVFWPIALLLSILLLFVGSEISWKDGNRWGNNFYEFSNLQYFWSTLTTLIYIIGLILFILKFHRI